MPKQGGSALFAVCGLRRLPAAIFGTGFETSLKQPYFKGLTGESDRRRETEGKDQLLAGAVPRPAGQAVVRCGIFLFAAALGVQACKPIGSNWEDHECEEPTLDCWTLCSCTLRRTRWPCKCHRVFLKPSRDLADSSQWEGLAGDEHPKPRCARVLETTREPPPPYDPEQNKVAGVSQARCQEWKS